jgi:transcriptional regulator with XRE-family HTH domain
MLYITVASPSQGLSHLFVAGGVRDAVTVAVDSQAERLRLAIGRGKVRGFSRQLADRTGRSAESHRRQLNAWLASKHSIDDENAELLADVLGKPKDYFKSADLLDAGELELLASGLTQIRAGLETLSRLQQRLARRAGPRSVR